MVFQTSSPRNQELATNLKKTKTRKRPSNHIKDWQKSVTAVARQYHDPQYYSTKRRKHSTEDWRRENHKALCEEMGREPLLPWSSKDFQRMTSIFAPMDLERKRNNGRTKYATESHLFRRPLNLSRGSQVLSTMPDCLGSEPTTIDNVDTFVTTRSLFSAMRSLLLLKSRSEWRQNFIPIGSQHTM